MKQIRKMTWVEFPPSVGFLLHFEKLRKQLASSFARFLPFPLKPIRREGTHRDTRLQVRDQITQKSSVKSLWGRNNNLSTTYNESLTVASCLTFFRSLISELISTYYFLCC